VGRRPGAAAVASVLAALPLALLGACAGDAKGGGGGSGSGSSGGGNGTGGGGPNGSGGNGGPGTGGGNTPGTGGVGFTLSCTAPNAGSPLLRLLTRGELQNTLGDVFPEVRAQWSGTLPASRVSAFGFDNDASGSVGKQLASALLETAEAVATAVTGTALGTILPCSTGAADRACAETFLTKYGKRLFRRPLTAAERTRYLTFFDASRAKADFKTSLKWMTVGLIQSPHAIYRSEVGAAMGSGRQLSAHEIAAALAYTYTGTTPSDALLAQADSGNMGDLVAQARTMLATDPGKQAMQRFFEGYLDYARVTAIAKPNIAAFAGASADMAQETRAFIDNVVLRNGGGLKQLLTANTTNPSRALASFYGFTTPATDYASVTRPAGRGLGILAQGSFLSTHASTDSSSPTKRGLFTFLRLLCRQKPTLPSDVPQIGAPEPGQRTTRQRYESVHAAPAGCGSCHKHFDPIGFGFEHFDEAGRYRADEGGLTIDATGNVLSDTTGMPLFTFDGQDDLVTKLAEQPVIHQCMAAHLATYAFGTNEACIGASKVPDLQAGTIGIAEAFAQLAAEPHFTRRNSQ
jgi:hypothetical protein